MCTSPPHLPLSHLLFLTFYVFYLSIRYEERSLGIYDEQHFEASDEPDANDLSRLEPRERVGKYVGWHLKRQLSNGGYSYSVLYFFLVFALPTSCPLFCFF
jgi:hypothetical protein